MSFFIPNGVGVPGSSNNTSGYIKILNVLKMTDSVLTIQNGIISNLNDPVQEKDAVNKIYLDDIVDSGSFGNISAESLTTPLITGLSAPVNNTDATNKAYVDSKISNPGGIEFQVIVQKDPIEGQYSTIESAIESITDASETRPYCIVVGPGVYNENELIVPAYVSIKGESINTTIISPNVPNQNMFVLSTNCEISFLTIKGISGSLSPGAGAGYAAIYCEDTGDFSQLHKLSIYDYDIGIDVYSSTADSILYVEYVDISNYSYAMKCRSNQSVNSGFTSVLDCENTYLYPSTTDIKTGILVDGVDSQLYLLACNFTGNDEMTGIYVANGGSISMSSCLFEDYDTGIISANIGLGPNLIIDGSSFTNCSKIFNILNIGTTGFFYGNAPKSQYTIVSGSTFFIASQDSKLVRVYKSGGDFNSISAALAYITDASINNQYIVTVGPGTFTESPFTIQSGVALIGSSIRTTTIATNNNTSNFITCSGSTGIQNLSITGPSTSGASIYYEGNSSGLAILIRTCMLNSSYIGISINGLNTNISQIDSCIFSGNFNTCFKINNTGNTLVRSSFNNITYSDLVAPVATYIFDVSGTNVNISISNCTFTIVPTSASTGVYIGSGSVVNIFGSLFNGFGKTIHIPSGSSNCILNGTGVLINNSVNYDLLVENISTTGSWNGTLQYTKTSIPIDSTFFINGTDATIIEVQKSGGDFTSIYSALNSITNNSSQNRYIIKVGPGRFVEPELVMKEFVSIHGSGRSTVVEADSDDHHIIRSCDFIEIMSMILFGAGPGYAAIYHETPLGTINTALICRNVLFGSNDIHVWSYGNIGTANVIIFNSRYGGTAQFNYGFKATNNNNSVISRITIIGTVSQNFTSPLPRYICYASGINCTISLNSFNAINDDTIENNTVGFQVDNGGFLRLLGCTVKGFDTAIYSINAGTAPEIISNGCTVNDCNTDINIQHPDTIGSINISASYSKTIVNNSPPISLFLVDPINTGIVFSGPFYYSENNFNETADISNLLIKTPTMGLISGGQLSISSGLTLSIASGTGYNTNVSDVINYQVWSSDTMVLPANTTSYVYVNPNGLFANSTNFPNSKNNIILGQVSTNASNIIYIQQIELDARNWSNYSDDMLRNAIGPVYSSGSQVAEVGTRQLNVSQGIYYYSSNKFTPEGGNPITFDIYYRSVVAGIYTAINNITNVPNQFYDNGSGTLQALTTNYYTKHLLCVLGGPSELYALIYGQDEYISQSAAESAGLPLTPSFITNSFTKVVSIVVQQGNTNIVSFIDERPRIGFVSSSVTGTITVHGDLLGLSANDHPQYLLVNGDAPGMTGNLLMNNNNINNVTNINNFPISSHAYRHAFNGEDALSPALVGDIAEISDSVAFAGINNTRIPRADHQHPHGNRGGGTLHASVVSGGANGFMTGVDKAKLDGIQAGATNTTASNIAPLNISKSAANAGISAEVSRQDHKHDIDTAAPITTLLTTSTNSAGTATTLIRSDHTHAISSDVPVTLIPDQSNAIGNSTAFARADHIHNIPTGIAAGLNANSTNSQGAASTFSISNHSHAIASGVPSNQTIAVSALTGTSINFARADHIHTFSTASPVSISTTNSEGVSTSFARADHVHNHGVQTDGTLHAIAVANGANGFLSGTDKAVIDQVSVLEDGKIFVGNVSNVPTAVAMSGDIGIINSGLTTIQPLAVTTGKIANSAVTDTQLSSTGVSANTYGSATQSAQIVVNEQGRLTSVTNIPIQLPYNYFFGNGSDGDVVISSNVTLSRSMMYNNLTVNTTRILNTAGYKIFVLNTCTIIGTGSIVCNGSNGGNGGVGSTSVAGTAGAAGAAIADTDLGGSLAGGAGGIGGTTTGGVGAQPAAIVSQGGGNGGGGGGGGTGGANAGGGGGAIRTNAQRGVYTLTHNLIAGVTILKGGASGSGGGGGGSAGGTDRGGGGGGGGSGGGIVLLWCKTLNNAGTISANGGNGGNGGSVGTFTTGAGGGGTGGGGGGGTVFLLYETLTSLGTVTATGGSAGTIVGTGAGTGVAGSLGTAGTAGRVVKYNLLTGVWS